MKIERRSDTWFVVSRLIEERLAKHRAMLETAGYTEVEYAELRGRIAELKYFQTTAPEQERDP